MTAINDEVVITGHQSCAKKIIRQEVKLKSKPMVAFDRAFKAFLRVFTLGDLFLF